MTRPPASLRYNNPGAMYPGPSSRKFGSTATETIGGGHKIAVFDDPVKGAAAQFDLLSRAYAGLPLSQAIAKWSGGNSSPAYTAQIAKVLGIDPNTVLSAEFLADPAKAVPLARTMAQWEAGRPYPLTDEQWAAAHSMATSGAPVQTASTSMPFALSPVTASAEPSTAPVAQEQAGLRLPFGLSLSGGNADVDLQMPALPVAEPPRPSVRQPLDLSRLAALAAERRKLGV